MDAHPKKPVALSIGGSDPSGGAGVQADLKTFHQFGVYGEAAITVITVQNTTGLERVEPLAPDLVSQQIQAVIRDIPPGAAKTGALGTPEIIAAVAGLAAEFRFPLVVDPVMISKHGARLLASGAVQSLKACLLRRTFLLTPNLEEASAIAGIEVCDIASMREAARRLTELGPQAVLVKGGHLAGDAVDVLFYRGEWQEFREPRVDTPHTHGSGCTYSAAITACLAAGDDLVTAIHKAKRYISAAIRSSPGLGAGSGPLNHHAPVK